MLHFTEPVKQNRSESEQYNSFSTLSRTIKESSLNLQSHYPHGFLAHHSNHMEKK